MQQLVNRLSGYFQLEAKGVYNSVNGIPLWLSLAIEGLIQAFPGKPSSFGNITHSVMPYHLPKGSDKSLRVFIIKTHGQEGANLVLIVKMIECVEFADFCFLDFVSHALIVSCRIQNTTKNVSNIAHSTASDYYVSSLAKSSDGIETPNTLGAQSRPYVIAAFFVPVLSESAERYCASHASLWWAGWATFGLAVSLGTVVSTRSARRPYEIETSLVAVTLPITQGVSAMNKLTIAPARADFKPLDGHFIRKTYNRLNGIASFFEINAEKRIGHTQWLLEQLLSCFQVSNLKQIPEDHRYLVTAWLDMSEGYAKRMADQRTHAYSMAQSQISLLQVEGVN